MMEEERIKQQRKNARKTAIRLFLLVIIIAAVYTLSFKTWIANKIKAKEAIKGNNLTKIVEPGDRNVMSKTGAKSDETGK